MCFWCLGRKGQTFPAPHLGFFEPGGQGNLPYILLILRTNTVGIAIPPSLKNFGKGLSAGMEQDSRTPRGICNMWYGMVAVELQSLAEARLYCFGVDGFSWSAVNLQRTGSGLVPMSKFCGVSSSLYNPVLEGLLSPNHHLRIVVCHQLSPSLISFVMLTIPGEDSGILGYSWLFTCPNATNCCWLVPIMEASLRSSLVTGCPLMSERVK